MVKYHTPTLDCIKSHWFKINILHDLMKLHHTSLRIGSYSLSSEQFDHCSIKRKDTSYCLLLDQVSQTV